ncbi:MAG: peptidoglycan DD-metalloendopeptidase family protein [Burkholderiales bacterium]|nr:peptidoglycan DD-metalloendopeptidase family protein [Burkholderiales bacterium]
MKLHSAVILLTVALIAGCSTRQPAPVVERKPADIARSTPAESKPSVTSGAATTPAATPRIHVVQKGETLIAVALQYGLDYKELAAWNNIENVNLIHVGQELRLAAPTQAAVPTGAVATPLPVAGVPVARPIDQPAPVAGTADAAGSALKTGPLAVKLPYSDKALADLEAEAKSGGGPASATAATPAPAAAPAATKPDDEKIDWAWPAKGKILAGYTEASKGIDIAGTLNAPVLAAADGKVMYSGTGIRGYGKLVILKHNNVFLSAYAHNQNILVKEGQDVKKGQKIAEMGATDTDQVKLHFEIRKQGKPVDPAKLLPAS